MAHLLASRFNSNRQLRERDSSRTCSSQRSAHPPSAGSSGVSHPYSQPPARAAWLAPAALVSQLSTAAAPVLARLAFGSASTSALPTPGWSPSGSGIAGLRTRPAPSPWLAVRSCAVSEAWSTVMDCGRLGCFLGRFAFAKESREVCRCGGAVG